MKVIYVGAGSFWTMEAAYRAMRGVVKVIYDESIISTDDYYVTVIQPKLEALQAQFPDKFFITA